MTLRSIFGVNRFLSVIDIYYVFERSKKLLYTFLMNLLRINIKPPTNSFPYFVKVFMEAENVSLASEWVQKGVGATLLFYINPYLSLFI